jgi:short-subunit dehydrogenase
MKIEGRRVLLTGATGGIGEEISAQLLDSGAFVLLQGRSSEKLKALLTKFEKYEGRVKVIAGDLCLAEDRQAINVAASSFRIDSLINSAGLNEFTSFEDGDINLIIQTNVTSTMLITQLLLPLLMSGPNKALILNIGSAFGMIGYPGYVAYCASKHAIKGFTEALMREYSDRNILISYVAPRATKTEMNGDEATKANDELGVNMDSPRVVATAVVNAIVRNQHRSQLGWPEKLQVKVNSLLPTIVDRAISKQLSTIKNNLLRKKENSHV